MKRFEEEVKGSFECEIIYIQATYQMADETTQLREFDNLQAINNNYPNMWSALINGQAEAMLGELCIFIWNNS